MGYQLVAVDHVQLAMPRGREPEARAFYQGLLGLEERPKPPVLAARGGCWFSNGRVTLHLGVEDDFRPARKAHPALVVEDSRRAVRDAPRTPATRCASTTRCPACVAVTSTTPSGIESS